MNLRCGNCGAAVELDKLSKDDPTCQRCGAYLISECKVLEPDDSADLPALEPTTDIVLEEK